MVLSHSNVLATIVAMQSYVKEAKLQYDSRDNVLSYLTMAHILGRVVEEFALSIGGHVGYWQVGAKRVSKFRGLPQSPCGGANSFPVKRLLQTHKTKAGD